MGYDVQKIRDDFPILASRVHGNPLVYLDNGATAQKPLAVIEHINRMHRELNANIHRGVHFMSEQATVMYEAARECVREFIGARSTDEIIFNSGATAGLNTVASILAEGVLRKGDNIIVSEMEHHSNIVPWQLVRDRKGVEIKVLPLSDDGRLMTERLPELIDGRTRILAVTQASNVLGTRPDLKAVIAEAKRHGVLTVVDGCQGIVHGGVDVVDLGCDFYLFSGHKLYAPTGIGVLYGRRELLEKLPPYMGGGDMVASVSFERTTYAELPLKYEAGTANYIGAIGMAEAIKYLLKLGINDIVRHETELLKYATGLLKSVDGMRIYGSTPDKCSIISFSVDGLHPTDTGMILDKLGIAVRTGTHCAEPVMRHYGVDSMCRASFALYNTKEEADALYEGVKKAVNMLRR